MNLSLEERERLATYTSAGTSNLLGRRAQVVLLYAEGATTREVAEQVGLSPGRARYWRTQFRRRGFAIFNRHKMPSEAPQAEHAALPPEPTPDVSAPPPEPTASLTDLAGPADLDGPTDLEENLPAPKSRKKSKKTPAAAPIPPKSPPAEPAAAEQPAAAEELAWPKRQAKAGVAATDRMAEAGRKVLLFHFAEMLAHDAGTRLGEDIEELHDMRVATRRMRAAFEIFEPFYERKVIKKHLKGLRATGRALGRVRDLDVFMEKAQVYLQTLPEADRPGLEPLLQAWQEERTKDREAMVAFLESSDYADFKRRFNRFLHNPGAGALPAEPVTPDHVREVAPILIYTRLAAVRAYEPILANAVIEQLHALRIEFKKLRYALEFFREVLGPTAKEVINDIKKMQDHLGDLNDADVATIILRQFLDGWDARQAERPLAERQNPEAIVDYLAYRHAERHQLMVSFCESWEYFMRPEFRAALAQSVAEL